MVKVDTRGRVVKREEKEEIQRKNLNKKKNEDLPALSYGQEFVKKKAQNFMFLILKIEKLLFCMLA